MDVQRSDEPGVTHSGPLPAYRRMLANGELKTDPGQALAAERLQALWLALKGYDPQRKANGGLLGRLFAPRQKKIEESSGDYPNGLYLVGEVGRGKSMLMDLFFAEAEVPRKRRVHFHRFMQEAHKSIFAWKRENPGGADPIPPLADKIAGEAALLCFDEFQINDIADAMILGRLFEALFARGVVVVATSNTPPDELFAGRPGRDAFLPFIALIKKHLDVMVLSGIQDYRRHRLQLLARWVVPADQRAKAALDRAFAVLSGDAHAEPAHLLVLGRRVEVPMAAQGVARFDFATLCGTPLGPGDYLALATHFHTLVLDNVPLLSVDNYDEARRFIILIDALYDHRVKLVASAGAAPDAIYPEGEGSKAFERTASRLMEMQSREYQDLAHLT